MIDILEKHANNLPAWKVNAVLCYFSAFEEYRCRVELDLFSLNSASLFMTI